MLCFNMEKKDFKKALSPYETIVQPNAITNARYEYSGVQKNIMTNINNVIAKSYDL